MYANFNEKCIFFPCLSPEVSISVIKQPAGSSRAGACRNLQRPRVGLKKRHVSVLLVSHALLSRVPTATAGWATRALASRVIPSRTSIKRFDGLHFTLGILTGDFFQFDSWVQDPLFRTNTRSPIDPTAVRGHRTGRHPEVSPRDGGLSPGTAQIDRTRAHTHAHANDRLEGRRAHGDRTPRDAARTH